MKVNDLLSLEITQVALGGKALARHDGRVVFVDRGLPGDRVRARLSRIRSRFAEARLEGLELASPERVLAPCPHVPRCGGCRFQDLAYPAQARIKEDQVRDTLIHLARIPDPPLRPLIPATETFGYRNKMEFTFTEDASGQAALGLHERGAFDRAFPLEECLLPSRLTLEIVRRTARFAAARGWRPYRPGREGVLARFLVVRHLPLTDQCAIHLVATSADLPGLADWVEEVSSLPAVRTVTLLVNRSRANVATGEEERILAGDGLVVERLLGLEFEASSTTFLQTNSRQAEILYGRVLDEAGLTGSETVLDLYSGVGTMTLLMARRARRAIGVESVLPAVAAARRNAERNRVANVRFVAGEARRVLREWARGEREDAVAPEVVVVDPPRAGLHPRVLARIAELEPRRVVYVSCNPGTLARDLQGLLARGFRLAAVTPVDMFPHTPHVECVAALDRGAR